MDEYNEENEQISDLADEIRTYWANEWESYQLQFGKNIKFPKSARWDGGKDSSGRSHPNIWMKIATFIKQKNVDPENLIRAQFYRYTAPEPPFPTILLSNHAIEKLNAYQSVYDDAIAKALTIQDEMFKLALWKSKLINNLTEKDCLAFILMDKHLAITALLRHLKAEASSLDKIANYWLDEAIRQYLKAPDAYDKYWQSVLTNKFKQKVNKYKTDNNHE